MGARPMLLSTDTVRTRRPSKKWVESSREKFIDELEPPTQNNFIVYDSKLRGFVGVGITSAGVKVLLSTTA